MRIGRGYKTPAEDVEKTAQLYRSGLSRKDVAKVLGISETVVAKRMRRAGLTPRSRTAAGRLAAPKIAAKHLGRPKGPWSEGRKRAASIRRLAEDRGVGWSLKPSGYIERTKGPDKGRSLHVLTWEKYHGQRVPKGHHIHHIDHDRGNNDISNLQIMTNAEHQRHHRRMERIKKR